MMPVIEVRDRIDCVTNQWEICIPVFCIWIVTAMKTVMHTYVQGSEPLQLCCVTVFTAGLPPFNASGLPLSIG